MQSQEVMVEVYMYYYHLQYRKKLRLIRLTRLTKHRLYSYNSCPFLACGTVMKEEYAKSDRLACSRDSVQTESDKSQRMVTGKIVQPSYRLNLPHEL